MVLQQFLMVLAVLVPGLLVGSFLNVVIYRVPRDESVAFPGSACTSCGTSISPRDNIPVLSWVLLRGRSRCCAQPISMRYPLVELGHALSWLIVAALAIGGIISTAAIPAFCYLASITLALSLIDLDVHRLPDVIVLPSYPVVAVLLAGATYWAPDAGGDWWRSLLYALWGAMLSWLLYFILAVAKPGGMGLGDVKLAGILGAYLGWLSWGHLAAGLFGGFVIGGIFSVALMALGKAGRKSKIPFGPFMFAGTWLAIIAGGPIIDWYLQLSGLSR